MELTTSGIGSRKSARSANEKRQDINLKMNHNRSNNTLDETRKTIKRHDNTRQDETRRRGQRRQDSTQNKTAQDKTGNGKTRDKARQEKTNKTR